MKEQSLNIQYQVAQLDELSDIEQQLVKKAMEATNNSYANYSHFYVGAACLLADGRIVIGANQENAAFPSGLCAERSAIFGAQSNYPEQAITTLAIAARNENGFLKKPDFPMWRMQTGNPRDGRPISATRSHLALRRELHLSLPQHQGLASILIRRCQYERIRFRIISSD